MSSDISNLTREQKLELLSLLEEKERRKTSSGAVFKPHPGQMRVIKSPALEKYLFPSNAYGKTALLVNSLHWVCTGFNPVTKTSSPVPAKVCLVVATTKDIDEVIVEYMKWNNLKEDQLHKRGKPHVSQLTFDNGSTITILTHEVSPLSLEGSQWTHLYFNEPPPKQVFTALYRGGRIKGRPLQVMLAGTPIAAAWLRSDMFEPWSRGELPHVECFQGRVEENAANLEDGYIERFKAILSEKERAIRLEGQFFDLDGLALAHLFKEHTHVVEDMTWDPDAPCVVVIDPHPSKAHFAVLMGADKDNRLYVLEEYKEKAIARHFAESLIKEGWFKRYRVTDIVYDSLGSADTTSGEGFRSFGEVVNEVLSEYSIGRARATTYDDKNDENFVERIRDALAIPEKPDSFGQRVPKLRFLSHCKGSIYDIKNVSWAADKRIDGNKPKLDIANKDYLACIKYALATNINFHKRKEKAFHYRKPAYGFSPQRSAKGPSRMRFGRGRSRPARAGDDD